MPSTLTQPRQSTPNQTLDSVRPQMAKALSASPAQSISWNEVVKQALIDHYGKLELAAQAMGNMDLSQLVRELSNGRFKDERLNRLDAPGKAAVSLALHRAYGNPESPAAYARRCVRQAREAIEQIEQYLDYTEAK